MALMTKEMVIRLLCFFLFRRKLIFFFFIIGEMLRINPQETIIFHKNENEYVGTVEIINIDQKPVTYKVDKILMFTKLFLIN